MRINLYAQEHTRDSYGVLTANLIRMSWLRALSKGCQCWCWCCGPGCWWLSARIRRAAVLVGCWCRPRVSWQSATVLVSAGCAHCRGAVSWLCVQAVYILVPASRMSTGRGMLPSYLGLCWFNLFFVHECCCMGAKVGTSKLESIFAECGEAQQSWLFQQQFAIMGCRCCRY